MMSDGVDSMTLARRAIEQALIKRAAQDAEFKALLLRDPRAALVQVLGVDPIPSYRIRIIEEAPGEVVLVLPHDAGAAELPDDLLDTVAGGVGQPSDEFTKIINAGGEPGTPFKPLG